MVSKHCKFTITGDGLKGCYLQGLEPCAGKLARTVLKRERDRKVSDLSGV